MYPLFAETHTAAGTLRLERIDRPADSRNEVRIPAGHTRDGLPVRATLDGRVLWRALFASGQFDYTPNGIWLFANCTVALVLAMGALYRVDVTDASNVTEVSDGVSALVVSRNLRVAVFTNMYDYDLTIWRLDAMGERHQFPDCTGSVFDIGGDAVIGSFETYHADDDPVPFTIDLAASTKAPSFVEFC